MSPIAVTPVRDKAKVGTSYFNPGFVFWKNQAGQQGDEQHETNAADRHARNVASNLIKNQLET
jgi:hypothetical protein